MPTRARKEEHADRLIELVNKYNKCLVVASQNVGSKQFGSIRACLRDGGGNKDACGVVYMGKNTLIRRTLSLMVDNPAAQKLLPLVAGRVGFIFTNSSDLTAVSDVLRDNEVGAPARAGQISDQTIVVPAGPTGQPPDKTAFFQALDCPTKISRGQIEIARDYVVCEPGDRINASQAVLLSMLNIRPFSYGLRVLSIYDNGEIYQPDILGITDDHLMAKFSAGVREVAALGFGTNTPNLASVPHSIVRGFQDLCAVAFACDNYTFDAADTVQDILANPDKYSAAGDNCAGTGATAEQVAGDTEPPEDVEEDFDIETNMFGEDDY
eukprot:COSAG01_NODE_5129_length_4468_cov_4.222477_1_plen_324_part_00